MLTPPRDFNFANNNTKIKQHLLSPPKDLNFANNNKKIEHYTSTTKRFQFC